MMIRVADPAHPVVTLEDLAAFLIPVGNLWTLPLLQAFEGMGHERLARAGLVYKTEVAAFCLWQTAQAPILAGRLASLLNGRIEGYIPGYAEALLWFAEECIDAFPK